MKNQNTTWQSLWIAAKVLLKSKYIVLNTYITKEVSKSITKAGKKSKLNANLTKMRE